MNKVTLHYVKIFPNVNLYSHVSTPTIIIHNIKAFRSSNNAVFNVSALNKTKLISRDNLRTNISKSICQNSSNYLKDKIT